MHWVAILEMNKVVKKKKAKNINNTIMEIAQSLRLVDIIFLQWIMVYDLNTRQIFKQSRTNIEWIYHFTTQFLEKFDRFLGIHTLGSAKWVI